MLGGHIIVDINFSMSNDECTGSGVEIDVKNERKKN